MSEFRLALERRPTKLSERAYDRLKPDFPKPDNDSDISQQLKLAQQIRSAIANFRGQQLVERRRAAAGGRDITVDEFQAVIARHRCRLIRKPGFVQCTVEPIAAAIAREHAPRPIASVRCRGQTYQQQFSVRVAEARIWLSPVIPVRKAPRLLLGNLFSPSNQTRTESAADDPFLKLSQRFTVDAGHSVSQRSKEWCRRQRRQA